MPSDEQKMPASLTATNASLPNVMSYSEFVMPAPIAFHVTASNDFKISPLAPTTQYDQLPNAALLSQFVVPDSILVQVTASVDARIVPSCPATRKRSLR